MDITLQDLASVQGPVSIHDGLAICESGQTFDLNAQVRKITAVFSALETLMADVEAIAGDGAYGFPLTDPQHPFYESWKAAREAVALKVPAVKAREPRVLVIVEGGVADYVCDPGIDVEVFDKDDFADDPINTCAVPAHFKDLVEGMDVPVQAD